MSDVPRPSDVPLRHRLLGVACAAGLFLAPVTAGVVVGGVTRSGGGALATPSRTGTDAGSPSQVPAGRPANGLGSTGTRR